MALRAVPPRNNAAMRQADDDFYGAHPEFVRADGSRIPLSGSDPGQEDLRQEWLASYRDHGGKVAEKGVSPKPPEAPVTPCPLKKTVTARVVALTFRSDHLDAAGGKLLRPSAGDFQDATAVFTKPEWLAAGRSDPVSHTKNRHVTVDVDIEFTVEPAGCTAQLSKLEGLAILPGLSFEKVENRNLSTGIQAFTGVVSDDKLPDFVTKFDDSIEWRATVDGKHVGAGATGPHTVYVTFDQPIGQLDSATANAFTETGTVQHVTEERLDWSVDAARGRGVSDEKECVDAVFEKLLRLGVGYSLGFRWEPGPAVNNTGVSNGTLAGGKPTLHHYLWRCNAATAQGECHNIAASFMLACRILGVQDPMEIGYMYPWPGRADTPPTYPRRGDKVQGRYSPDASKRYWRGHADDGHPVEFCVFLDGRHQPNNFEGVARYRSAILYAIGDVRLDQYGTVDENASVYYSKRTTGGAGLVASHDLSKGWAELCFYSDSGFCQRVYPWSPAPVAYLQPKGWTLHASAFHWHD